MLLSLRVTFLIAVFWVNAGCNPKTLPGGNTSKKEYTARAFMTLAQIKIWQRKGNPAIFYKAGMKIDADGSPHAYHPQGEGLDYNYNGGSGGHWWGVITDDAGKPVIQGLNDPAPGYYVSGTSLEDRSKNKFDPARYVNAEIVPYIVLPERLYTKANVKLGDFAAVINKKNGKIAYAIFADIGPAGKLGEGSIALANNLEIYSNPKDGGADEDIIYLIFPGSGNGEHRDLEEIHSIGPKLLKDWGGEDLLLSFFP
jgi:hypothetical protein